MDAYDIFKKLTKGLKFNKPVLGVKTQVSTKNDKENKEDVDDIKNEDILSENEEISDSGSYHNIADDEDNGSPSENESNGEIELAEGIKVGKNSNKKKVKEKSEDLKKKLDLEEQNHFRNLHGIKAVGRHIPAALKDMSELVTKYNVSQKLVDIVNKCGYTEPTPIQRQAMSCMLEDRQTLSIAPTGSGKTAAFLIPILHSLGAPQGGPRALILCPTRELAVQIYREALRLSEGTELRCSVIRKLQESKIKEREATFRKSDIVISTPNRLCYLLNQDNVTIKLDRVRWLIIDEADKLFEGSKDQDSDFRQQMEQILTTCTSKDRRVCMYSATHTPRVAQWARRNLRGVVNVTVGVRNAATHLVVQELLYCGNENGKLVAFRQLVQKGLNPPVLVFVQSKDRAKQLFKELIYDGINVDVIHADRTQAQRDAVVRAFRIGRIWVLICTELMGRGIDFRGVNLVINYDFPPSAIAYIHRVGRAGRAGQKGRAITFFTQDDVANLRSIASVMKQSGCDVPEYMLKLKNDRNKRKNLVKKAPRRDKISTILEKNANKRKLEEGKEKQKPDDTKSTDKVNSSKNKKQRKLDKRNVFNKTIEPERKKKFKKKRLNKEHSSGKLVKNKVKVKTATNVKK